MREFRFGRGIEKSHLEGGYAFYTEADIVIQYDRTTVPSSVGYRILNQEIYMGDHIEYLQRMCSFITDSIYYNTANVIHTENGTHSILDMTFNNSLSEDMFYYVRARYWPIEWTNRWMNIEVRVTYGHDGVYSHNIMGYNIENDNLPF